MTKKDDRTPEQKKTHVYGVVAKDNFMSGWGHARGNGGTPFGMDGDGISRCAWACHPDVNIDRVENWVRNRSEMRYVNVVNLNTYRAPRGTTHFHIYVCEPDHVAARY